MLRLIDADLLMPNAEYKGKYDTVNAYDIVNCPTVDAVVVRHGHWVHGKELSRDYIGDVCVSIHYDKCWCSECNYPVEGQALWMYCPNCGAKMDSPCSNCQEFDCYGCETKIDKERREDGHTER